MLFASPVDDGQGAVTSHFLSYLDITRRWEAEYPKGGSAVQVLTEFIGAPTRARRRAGAVREPL